AHSALVGCCHDVRIRPMRRVAAAIVLAVIALFATQLVLRVIRSAGVNFMHRNSPTAQKHLIETMGGGVALLDYNNDGLLDIFFVNSGKIRANAGLGSNEDSFDRGNPLYWNRLFRQSNNGSFVDVTSAAGLASAGDGNYGM